MLADLSVTQLLEKTAAAEPVPGGGSMAALQAAVAAALAEMVANVTIGRKRYQAVEEDMRRVASQAAALRRQMLAAVDRDADAYRQVVAALRLPSGTEAEKAAREEAVQAALKSAALVPLENARQALAVMELAGEALAKGNRNACSDAAVGVMSARTAVRGAVLNVRINLADIGDEKFAAELGAEADRLAERARRLEASLLAELPGGQGA